MMEGHVVPEGFEPLLPFVSRWALESEAKRYRERVRSNLEELRQFYDAAMPLAEKAIQLLNRYPASGGGIPQDISTLNYLMLSLMEISRSIELWHRVDVHCDNYAPERVIIRN
jgi:hypothetical protein